jgi:hypothetical protein
MEQPKTIPANIFDEMAGMKDTKNRRKKIAENDNIQFNKQYSITPQRLKNIFSSFQKNIYNKIANKLLKLKKLNKKDTDILTVKVKVKKIKKEKENKKTFFDKIFDFLKSLYKIYSNISLVYEYINFVKVGIEKKWDFNLILEHYIAEFNEKITEIKKFINDPVGFIKEKINSISTNIKNFFTNTIFPKNKKKLPNNTEDSNISDNSEKKVLDRLISWFSDGIDVFFDWLTDAIKDLFLLGSGFKNKINNNLLKRFNVTSTAPFKWNSPMVFSNKKIDTQPIESIYDNFIKRTPAKNIENNIISKLSDKIKNPSSSSDNQLKILRAYIRNYNENKKNRIKAKIPNAESNDVSIKTEKSVIPSIEVPKVQAPKITNNAITPANIIIKDKTKTTIPFINLPPEVDNSDDTKISIMNKDFLSLLRGRTAALKTLLGAVQEHGQISFTN